MEGPDLAALRARVAGLSPAQREALRAKVEAAGIAWSQVAPETPWPAIAAAIAQRATEAARLDRDLPSLQMH